MSKTLGARIMWAGGVAAALGSIGTVFIYAATTYTGVRRAVTATPRLERRVSAMDRRLRLLEWYVPAIGKRLGVPAPPAALLADAIETDEEAKP